MNTIKVQFRSAINRGTGAAYLLIKEHPAIDFSSDILKACINNLAYDAQSEGSRGHYQVSLIMLSRQKEKIIDRLLQALINLKEENDWGLYQLFDIARILATRGNEAAAAALHKRYQLCLQAGYCYEGAASVIALDGLLGLKIVAELRGKMLLADPDEWEDNSIISLFEEEHPDIDVLKELSNEARHNKYIRRYLQAIQENSLLKAEESIRPSVTYDTIRKRINKGNTIPLAFFARRMNELDQSEINKLANDLLSMANKEKQTDYVRLFSNTPFPYGYAPLLALAKSTNPVNDAHRMAVITSALKHFKAAEIEAFAISKLATANDPALYINLLINNYPQGYHKTLAAIASKFKSEHVIDHLATSFTDIYSANKTADCLEPLMAIYNKGNCGICRAKIIKMLADMRLIPDEMGKELPYDSYEEVRIIGRSRKLD